MVDLTPKLDYLGHTSDRIVKAVSVLYGTSEDATLREAVDALYEEAFGSPPDDIEEQRNVGIAPKLVYLNVTKQRFMAAMVELEYDVDEDTTFREAANLLYADACAILADDLDVSSLPSYWQQDVKDTYAYTMALDDEYIHHLVTTDNHFSKNYHNSVPILEVLQGTGLYGRMINLGDIADSNTDSYWEEAFTGFGQWNGNLLFAMGNHDAQQNVGVSDFYDALISNDEELVGQTKTHFSYYWDDAEHKIRYIVYDTYHYQSEGANFLKESIRTLPDGWSVISLTHYWNRADDAMVFLSITQAPFIANLAGHGHVDGTWSKFGGAFKECRLSNDGNSNDASGYEKVQGTTTEQAITIVSINTRTKVIKYYRLGAPTGLGKQWQRSFAFDYDFDNWVRGYYYNTGGIQSTDNTYSRINTRRYPAVDENGTPITYYMYGKNGGYCYQGYVIPFLKNKSFFNHRQSTVTSSAFNNIFVTGRPKNSRWESNNVQWLLFSGNFPNVETDDDIVITTERPVINTVFEDIAWTTGSYIGTNWAVTDNVNGATMSKAMSVTPGQKYHFWVDNEDYVDTYLYAWIWDAKLDHKTRFGITGDATEVTFTIPSGGYYMIISGNNLANYIEDVKLEIIT